MGRMAWWNSPTGAGEPLENEDKKEDVEVFVLLM